MALCPCCRSFYSDVGILCPADGYYSISEEQLPQNDGMFGRVVDGKYVILSRLGQGGMGCVYEAKQLSFGRVVALKILSTKFRAGEEAFRRFQVEAESVGMLSHPHIVQLYDTGFDDDGNPYIAMEYVQGRVLSSLNAQEITCELISRIAYQVLSALEEAHSSNIIHRDLKPDNIMLTSVHNDNYFVKVLDFGLAVFTDESRGNSETREALGTPWYMSPEQATASKAQFASDIYSLGCILYELLTSRPPFPGTRPFNVMMQHVNAPVPPIEARLGLYPSDALQDFIMHCLSKSLKSRYSHAREALTDLVKVPEWEEAQKLDPSHSLRLGLQQIRDEAETRSGVSSVISASTDKARSNSGVFRTSSGVHRLDSGLYAIDSVMQSSGEFSTVSDVIELDRSDVSLSLQNMETLHVASPIPYNLGEKRVYGIRRVIRFLKQNIVLTAILVIFLFSLIVFFILLNLDLI